MNSETSSIKECGEPGCRPPNFELNDVEGKTYRLYEFLGQKNIILWTTNLCSGCQKKIPLLEELLKTFGEKLEIFAISVLGNDTETPKAVCEKQRMSFPVLLDPHDWVGTKLGFVHEGDACPMANFLIIDRSEKIVFKDHLSRIKENRLREIVSALNEE